MPRKDSLQIDEVFTGRFALVGTVGKKTAVLSVAEDGDSDEDVLAAAVRWRAELLRPIRHRRVDKNADVDRVKGNSCPPSQASG